jgi:enoyl-CoA hydratase/carnithine racemase
VSYEQIIYTKDDGVAIITLNRPQVLNAFTPIMIDEWVQAIEATKVDPEVRAVIVTGAGRGFCSGADVRSFREREHTDGNPVVDGRYWLQHSVHRVPLALRTLDKPYIAAVNGPAAGAGMDMASMADLRIASETVRFTMSYVNVGIVPGDGGCYYLPRIVGVARALDLIWTGRTMDAQEALQIGYVSQVVPPDQLMETVMTYAKKLAKGPQVAIELAKCLVYGAWKPITYSKNCARLNMPCLSPAPPRMLLKAHVPGWKSIPRSLRDDSKERHMCGAVAAR